MSLSSGPPQALERAQLALDRANQTAPELAWDLLIAASGDNSPAFAPISAIKSEGGLQGDELERLLLWHAAQQAVPRIAGLPIDASVKRMLEAEVPRLWAAKEALAVGSYAFDRAAKLATLRRFPAGPMEWEISGIPRSWVLRAGLSDRLRLLACVARLGGFAPCFFMHVAPAPRNRGLSIEKQVLQAYYRMAGSLAWQPHVRALIACAWFHDPAAVKDYPHLKLLSLPYLTNGGLIVRLGPAGLDSGVVQGNAQRKADYEAGKVQYRYGLAIWPRKDALRWAQSRPELAE